MQNNSDKIAKIQSMLADYELKHGKVDIEVSDSSNCSFCSASCFSTNCRSVCQSAIAPRISR